MCYPSPGPRCSQHAWIQLERCKRMLERAEALGDPDALSRARKSVENAKREFFTTPKGHKYLEAKIAETGDPSGNLRKALEQGKKARKDAMDAYKKLNPKTSKVSTKKPAQDKAIESSLSPAAVEPQRLNFTSAELQKELNLVNDSGDRLFIPGSLRVSNFGQENMHLSWNSYTHGECRMQISLKEQSFMAYKSYGDEEEEEFLTEARPALQGKFQDFKRNKDYGSSPSEIAASNLADAVEDLDTPGRNWNKDTHAVSFMYFGEAHGDINSALRNKTPFNKDAIATLDKVMSRDTLQKEVTVYRGIRDYNGTVRKQIESGTYRDGGYLSTTTAQKTAVNFSGGGRKGSVLMKLTLPAGTKCADLRKDSEAEIALPRDFDLSTAEWTFF